MVVHSRAGVLKQSQQDKKVTMTEPGTPHGRQTPHAFMQQRLRTMTDELPDENVKRTVHDRCRTLSEEPFDNSAQKPPEDVMFRNFPIISDLLSFFFYAVALCFRMIRWFRFWWWTVQLAFRTIVWTTMMLPGLLPYAVAYFRDGRIQRRIRFGATPREYLDIYMPDQAKLAARGEGKKVPVVIAVMGGGFLIGHRSYNVQLGLRCLDFGVMFVCIDYRNFPFARIPDMVENVSRGIRWVFQNIEEFGGDVNNMLLTGQSAGAHLTAMALVEHCLLEAKHEHEMQNASDLKGDGDFDIWSVGQFKAYLGVSGPYDIERMAPFIGLPQRAVKWLTMGDPDGCSPGFLVSSDEWREVAQLAAKRLPPIRLFHGEDDILVPSYASKDFAQQLSKAGVKVEEDVRQGLNHTYAVIEGPIIRHDIQLELILPILLGDGVEKQIPSKTSSKPMVPRSVVKLAACLSPFGKVSEPYIDAPIWHALLLVQLLMLMVIGFCFRFY